MATNTFNRSHVYDLLKDEMGSPVRNRKELLDLMRSEGEEYGYNPKRIDPYYGSQINLQMPTDLVNRAGIYLAPTHGAVPDEVKDSYLEQMLDHYTNAEPFQHTLVPQGWEEGPQRGHGPAGFTAPPRYVHTSTDYRPEGMPEHLSYGDVGPDYITMMNIMKAQDDPHFNIGFMGEEYMKEVPRTGAYYSDIDQTIALNPYDALDFTDPSVDAAFSLGAGKPRTLKDLKEGEMKFNFLEDTPYVDVKHRSDHYINQDIDIENWKKRRQRNVLAHEMGHYGTLYDQNTPNWVGLFGKDMTTNKFNFPHNTRNINMTRWGPHDQGSFWRSPIPDEDVMDVKGHNQAYWVGRTHDWRDNDPGKGMYLTKQGAENYAAWDAAAKNYIRNGPVESASTPQQRPSGPIESQRGAGRRPRHHSFNAGGIAGLPGQWTPSMSESEEEEYNIRPFQLDPGIMSIDDLEDLFEEAGLDKSIIRKLINSGGLSQLIS